MRILVLGAGGMLGHKMFQYARERFPDTWGSIRKDTAREVRRGVALFDTDRIVGNVDVEDLDSLERMVSDLQPAVTINCVGVIKQRPEAHDAIPSITINALLPHRLALATAAWSGRVIHFSTDCVFSGRSGCYTEQDPSDAEDLYGKTKYLGEVATGNALTLRTSIIGRELRNHTSLLDWLLSQNHTTVNGFTQAWWSGVTTNHLSRLVCDLIAQHPTLSGLYHLSSTRISKYHLLHMLRDAYGLDIEIVPDDSVRCDRSLSGERLRAAIGYDCPPWESLMEELASDPTPYEQWTEGNEVSGR